MMLADLPKANQQSAAASRNIESLLVQVVTKLVDPSTGVVLANARNFSDTKVESVDTLFENDADGYKRFFQTITTELVEDCIADLGLR